MPTSFTANGVTYTQLPGGAGYETSDGRSVSVAAARAIYNAVGQQGASAEAADTVKAADGNTYQWNPTTGRYDIPVGGVPASTPDANLGNGVYQDDRGFYVWDEPQRDSGLGVTTPSRKRYITAAEAKNLTNPDAPRQTTRPPQPDTYIDPRTGDLVAIDPYTGNEVYRINGVAFPETSPADQRAYDLGAAATDRLFTATENQKTRDFNAAQSGLDRAIRAADLATSINFKNQELAFAAEQDFQNRMRQYTQDKLGAAQQVADNISNVDPGALSAFYEAGGGVIANALRNGGTARSELSDYGSAAALRASDEMTAPSRYAFTPVAFDVNQFLNPVQTGNSGGFTTSTPAPSVPTASPTVSYLNPEARQTGGVVSTTNYANAADFASKGSPFERNKLIGMADGGMSGGQPVVVGEQGPEVVVASGPFAVLNEDQLGVDPMKLRAPRAATGGLFTGTDPITITEADRPYLDRVGAVRDNVRFPDLNPFDVRFALNAPSQIARFFAGRQTKYAVPVQDQAAEAQRFALPGISRGGFALGV